MRDFELSEFHAYSGPNPHFNRQALTFSLHLDPDGPRAEGYRPAVLAAFPHLEPRLPDRVVDLFCTALVEVLRMGIDLYLSRWSATTDGDRYRVAVETLDHRVAEEAAHLVADWFRAVGRGRQFDFAHEFARLQARFDRTLYGGPTLYSLIEAGLKRDIPVFYLKEENQFQWGYGRKAVRGRSTTFHVDSIKDTEFTTFKDMVKEFLLECGFPTPRGATAYTSAEAEGAAEELGFPLVVKPVAGHKGQGVVTGIESLDGVRRAFADILAAAGGGGFDGAIVEQQVYGTDHRLLAVGGRFVAALERVPASVDGDGTSTVRDLVERENATVARLDNARSPLCKIKVDEDLKDYLRLQGRSLDTVPAAGERVVLRRVANISAGGVSVNVTDRIHPVNVRLVEDIAKFFRVTCLGIDVLTEDISKPWTDGKLGIIEVNAGPGVFMHLAPAIGEPVDVPGMIIRTHFPRPGSDRVPIIAGNRLGLGLCSRLYERLRASRPTVEFGSLTPEGVHFNGEYFHRNPRHDQNVRIILRNPKLDFAAFSHDHEDLARFGTMHQGADVVVLEDPDPTEEVLARDLLADGALIRLEGGTVRTTRGGAEVATRPVGPGANHEQVLFEVLEPLLDDLLVKYD